MHTVILAQETYEMGNRLIEGVVDGRRLRVAIPSAAVTNRQALYGVETEQAAVTAILKEHVTRLLDLADDTHPDPRIARMGGLRKDVTIRWGTPADLPPMPQRQPTAKERLLQAAETATTLEELKAAIVAFAREA